MMAEEINQRLHALVEGMVQGVSFRYFVIEHAGRLQLTGWVRNTWDGRVEVTAEGHYSSLETLLKSLQEGPPAAQVTKVDYQWLPATGEFTQFNVRPNS